MQLRPRLWLVVFGVLFFLAMGCSRDVPPPDDALETPEELRGAVDARLDPVEDARFRSVTLEYFGDGDRVRLRQLLLVQRPDRLRIQTRVPASDEIMSLLVSDGTTFALHERDENTYYTGRPTRENINRLLPVDLSARDVVRVMLGSAPWDRFDEQSGEPTMQWDRDEGDYRYAIEADDGTVLSMRVRHSDFAVVGVEERTADGELVYSYTTDDWDPAGPVELPSYRRFQWSDRDLDFSLDVGETELNNNLDSHLFEFPPPPGSRVIEVGD